MFKQLFGVWLVLHGKLAGAARCSGWRLLQQRSCTIHTSQNILKIKIKIKLKKTVSSGMMFFLVSCRNFVSFAAFFFGRVFGVCCETWVSTAGPSCSWLTLIETVVSIWFALLFSVGFGSLTFRYWWTTLLLKLARVGSSLMG